MNLNDEIAKSKLHQRWMENFKARHKDDWPEYQKTLDRMRKGESPYKILAELGFGGIIGGEMK